MSKVITNRNQYEKLLSLLSERPDIAQGSPKTDKENVISFWDEVAVQLNHLGPPTKDMTSWKKVWLDYKCYIKRKLSINEAEARAAGSKRMQTFNALEESVINLAGLVPSTSWIKATNSGCGSSKNVSNSEEDSISNSDAEVNLPTSKKRKYDAERDFEIKSEHQTFNIFGQGVATQSPDKKECQIFSLFGQSVAAQLADLPEEEAFPAIAEIQNMLVARKMNTLKKQKLNKTQDTTTSRGNDELLICDVKDEYQVTEYLYAENE